MCVIAPASWADDVPPPVLPLGATVLFADASDFDQWRGDRSYWTVEGDTIVGTNPADRPLPSHTYLIFNGQANDEPAVFGDFELTAQFKIEGEGGNSGIQYRGKVVDAEKFKVAGYQADIDFGNRYAGILYEQDGRGIVAKRGEAVTVDEDGKKKVQRFANAEALGNGIHPGQWNDYRIVANGHELEHYINETLVSRVTDHQTDRRRDNGVIALQLHKGPPMTVRYRNVILRQR